MGVARLFLGMFIRKLKNRSGSISVQLISKSNGKYKVVQTIGCGKTEQEISRLYFIAKQEKERVSNQLKLFVSENDTVVEQVFSELSNSSIKTIGPEIIFGKIYDHIGYNQIAEKLFRHLVISRLAFPLSKLKTIDYLQRYQGVELNINAIYRFLDKLSGTIKEQVENITYTHTTKILGGNISIVFYDMTTIYFEASEEDDLRKTGFSKDGKHQNPQIFLGLLVGLGGYAIGYEIFEGNTYEGETLIPFLKKIVAKFNLSKPIIVADAGLLSNKNIEALEANQHQYIIGARIKNEKAEIKKKIFAKPLKDGQIKRIKKEGNNRLIITYSKKRASKDNHTRTRGLKRLEKRVKSEKLTKANINNRGYNKYLKLKGTLLVEVDYKAFEKDALWDGLKGYITNAKITDKQVIENYKNLWHIEKAFRMSKTDLRIRPIYHRLKHRIEA